MTEQEVRELLRKYKAGECTAEEQAFMDSWYADLEKHSPDQVYCSPEQGEDQVWQLALAKYQLTKPHRRPYYWPVAAAVLFVIGAVVWSFKYYRSEVLPVGPADLYTYNKAHDIQAGTNKAILTLADGKVISLDDAVTGQVADQNGVTINKNSKGQLVYTTAHSSSGRVNAMAYNTIITPKGGQYDIILPDGSQVFLNAASSLKYPVSFNGAERMVELNGEGYFMVAKNERQPFIVSTADQSVKVLGTHFNITNYPGEATITTLVEGSIQITTPTVLSKRLKPGQQAIRTGQDLQITAVDAQEAVAWKDGLFVFRKTPIQQVLAQLCRWYDMDTEDLLLPDITFDGEIPRDQPLSELLNVIAENSHVKLKIEGRRILKQR